nr:retrotransposon protein, putative, unclassified [Tanacetum cinerariifolium]
MSMMGEITFFLGFQVNQSPCGIFINQSNYVLEILKKYGMKSCDPVGTPMEIKDADYAVCKDTFKSTSGGAQFLGEKLSRRDLPRNTPLDRVEVLGLDLTYAPSTITTQQPSEGELDLLFEAMYDDYIGGQPLDIARTVLAAQTRQSRRDLPRNTPLDRVEVLVMNRNPSRVNVKELCGSSSSPSNLLLFRVVCDGNDKAINYVR